LSGVLALAASVARSADKFYRIGFIGMGTDPRGGNQPTQGPGPQYLDAFRQGLKERGWVEGENYILDRRYEEGKPERYPQLAQELVQLRPDVLVTIQTPGIRALMGATQTIPIVMIAPGDPVGSGLVGSLARSGNNVTGLAFDIDLGTYLKQVEFMREIAPNLSAVGVMSNPLATLPPVAPLTQGISQSLGLKAVVAQAKSADEIEPAFAELHRQGVKAAIVIVDGLLVSNVKRVAEMGLKYQIALGSQWQGVPAAGGLMSYAPDLAENFARAAGFVDRILRGAKPTDLPVQRPERVNLILNAGTARALGLVIPRSLLVRASQVIE
jgi:putative ABC transport system substrate-binding protein